MWLVAVGQIHIFLNFRSVHRVDHSIQQLSDGVMPKLHSESYSRACLFYYKLFVCKLVLFSANVMLKEKRKVI